MNIITLLTDFGNDDTFVGTIKGTIAGIAPGCNVIDLTHAIKNHDIKEAAYRLGAVYDRFPKKSVHMAVVDPGVGSRRRSIIVVTADYFFVGPDNGIFTQVFEKNETAVVYEIMASAYITDETSATFHGRDIFAPVAAHLANGVEPEKMGRPIDDPLLLDLPKVTLLPNGRMQGRVIFFDKFGNAATNIPNSALGQGSDLCVWIDDIRIRVVESYDEGEPQKLNALKGSDGTIEIFCKNGNAKTIGNLEAFKSVIKI